MDLSGSDKPDLTSLSATERIIWDSASSQSGESTSESRAGDGRGFVQQSKAEKVSRERDTEALEAASCLVEARRGDVIVMFPQLFHRTQDVAASRLALLVEAL